MIRALACLIGCSQLASCAAKEPPDGRTREGLTAGYELVLEGNDADDDGKLSTREVRSMVASSFSANNGKAPEHRKMHDWLVEDYAAQDTDRDGYLSLEELLKEPLATFGCMDTNSDDFLGQSETQAGLGRCDNGRPFVAS